MSFLIAAPLVALAAIALVALAICMIGKGVANDPH